MTYESESQQEIQSQAGYQNLTLWRNNSGGFYDSYGNFTRFGLGNVSQKWNKEYKSSDLIGIQTIVITPEDVGKTMGIFSAVEVKPKGWKWSGTKREIAQHNFLKIVCRYGGRGIFATNSKDLKLLLR